MQCLLDSALDPVVEEAIRGKTGAEAEKAILALKVCDPAVGSGHFLVAAAHRLARHLARVRANTQGESEPSPLLYQHALRDVIGRCLYGVDISPMSAELCRVSLWLEALEPGKPLSFLEHHIQVGNSLLGTTPELMAKGIPDAAFEPIEGDDKAVCREYKSLNKDQRSGQGDMFGIFEGRPWERLGNFAAALQNLETLADDTPEQVEAKTRAYEQAVTSGPYLSNKLLADAWCAAFVWKKAKNNHPEGFLEPITQKTFETIAENPNKVPQSTRDEIRRLARQYQFFHWHLAFPDVFQPRASIVAADPAGWSGGFDVVLSNPPWDELRPEERKFFGGVNPTVTLIENSAERGRAIANLATSDPETWKQWQDYRRVILGIAHFLHASGLFPLTSPGNLSTANLFVELSSYLIAEDARAGALVPSGLATNKGTSALFRYLVTTRVLRELYDFENQKLFFPSVHASMRFSLLTLSGRAGRTAEARFGFFLERVGDIADNSRVFPLTDEDIACVNPLSHTCPVFRTSVSARIVKGIHKAHPIVGSRKTDDKESWSTMTSSMFQMSHEADELFRDQRQVDHPVMLYEGKMVGQFNHRAASISINDKNEARQASGELSTSGRLLDPRYSPLPQYWVRFDSVEQKLRGKWSRPWLMHFCAVTSPTNERTCIATITPRVGAGHSLFQIYLYHSTSECLCFLSNINAFALDFVLREKMGGINLSHFIFEQLPVVARRRYSEADWDASINNGCWISQRVLELTYTAWDLEQFAQDCGYEGPPFRWDEQRRFLLRCELDAAHLHLYGIEREDVDYIMDTFPIVRRKDQENYNGDYRTKRVILEIYDAMQEAIRTGRP